MALSATPSLCTTRDEQTGVATLQLSRAPQNLLSLQFMKEILIELDRLETQGCRGVIITSAMPGTWCGGLEIADLMSRDRSRQEQFFKTFQKLFMRLYGTKMVTIAAIEGNAPLAGCLLAMSCDYRIMADDNKSVIGLPESRIGLTVPFWMADIMSNIIGPRETERAILLGLVYNSQDAAKVGFVDKLCSPGEVKRTAEEEIKRWLAIPATAFQLNKKSLRKPALDELKEARNEDVRDYLEFILKDETQAMLMKLVEALKKNMHNKEATVDEILNSLEL